jgi:hypothetical protein
MKHRITATLCLFGLLSLAAPVALAHHSFSMYDLAKSVTLNGAVKNFQWTNPHIIIWVNAEPSGGGEPQLWAVETSSPGLLTRAGWTRRSLQPGDKVVIEIAPLRDGSRGGAMKKVTVGATGKVLTFDVLSLDKPRIE